MKSIILPVCSSGATLWEWNVEPDWVASPGADAFLPFALEGLALAPGDTVAQLGTITFMSAIPGQVRPVPQVPLDCVPLELLKFHAIEDVLRAFTCWPRQQPVQKRIALRDLHHPRLSLREPIEVSVETWDNMVTAYCYDLDEFEAAQDEFSVLNDLRASIADLYYILKSEQGNLGPLPQEQWSYLSRIVRER